ncbi:hypothetical protein A9O67_07645 [Tepidimonas fonticaldi]|uniref:Glycosyltransferase RgtA/B/C/D-like domain-containing protein n=1 Tax=Tepidimonas fonticaldi TaxID=1101373 RepID=A0A1A6DVK2_9BURK|nr:glycosyltransferase family 39 protein [Tepidimonas fonticaldi]OBS30820.1 hypothetical protein A9O67_07645 [Tepidimonas fonticaldi]
MVLHSAEASADRRLWHAGLIALAIYFGLHAAVRVGVSPSPELDEAEQLVWTQRLAWGYGTQPPLYTWVQAVWFELVGVSVLGLTTLKNALLWICHAATAAAVRRIAGTRAAWVATASLLWLPTLGWESQRDLTHTVLATTLAAVALWLFVRIAQDGRARDYLALGWVAGAGVLAKYNFVLFVVLAVAAAATVPALRQRLFCRWTLWAIVIALAVALPHLLWAIDHWHLVSDQTLDKMTRHDARALPARLGAAALTLLSFATPWWVAFGVALAVDRRQRRGEGASPTQGDARNCVLRQWALAYLGLALLMLGGLVALGASDIKARWLQPWLFLLPALAVWIARIDGHGRAWRGFLAASVLLGLTWVVLMAARGYHQAARGTPDEWNVPIPALAQALREAGFSRGVIVSPQAVIAGGLRLQFPDSTVVVAPHPLPDVGGQTQVFVQTNHDGEALAPWPVATAPRSVQLPFLYARSDTPLFEARFAVLPPARP